MAKLIELDKVLEIFEKQKEEANDTEYPEYYMDGIQDEISDLPTTETVWISVYERLPKETVVYIAWLDITESAIEIVYKSKESNFFYSFESQSPALWIYYWMPLQEAHI